jgi:hypothetical protein
MFPVQIDVRLLIVCSSTLIFHLFLPSCSTSTLSFIFLPDSPRSYSMMCTIVLPCCTSFTTHTGHLLHNMTLCTKSCGLGHAMSGGFGLAWVLRKPKLGLWGQATRISSILRSGSVWLFNPKMGNQQLQPDPTNTQPRGTTTSQVQPVPVSPVVPKDQSELVLPAGFVS